MQKVINALYVLMLLMKGLFLYCLGNKTQCDIATYCSSFFALASVSEMCEDLMIFNVVRY